MKVIKWILIVIGAIIVIGLVVALFLPKTVDITSTTEVNQPVPKVFHSIASYSDREAWDPWVALDSTTVVEIVPLPGYVGSTYEWVGDQIGTGKMEVDSIAYPTHITAKIWFGGQPDPATVTWDFENADNGTRVTWGFHADAPYPLGRLILNMMKGGLQSDLDLGLERLKSHLESSEIQISNLSEIVETEIPEKITMVAKTSGTMDLVVSNMENMFNSVMSTVGEQGLEITGHPFCYYTDYNPEDQTTTAYCGVPVAMAGEPTEDVFPVTFPASRAIEALHTGPYEEFSISYTKLMEYVNENNLPVNWNAWEVYINDPMEVKYPALYKTEIYFELE